MEKQHVGVHFKRANYMKIFGKAISTGGPANGKTIPLVAFASSVAAGARHKYLAKEFGRIRE